ncbi:NIPSNAP family protein [Paraburkholderia youngii]|uniref:NIPSNAP family protein n=1 Tax=Paraburkholderia youngii TaxID=2782701 RepID=UPI003D22D244
MSQEVQPMRFSPEAAMRPSTEVEESSSVFEFRTYEMVPSLVRYYLSVVDQSLQRIRQDEYGRLIGFWYSEFGGSCSVYHLWEFPSLDARRKARQVLGQRAEWEEFLRSVAPAINAQSIDFLRAQTRVDNAATNSWCYEMNRYQAVVGEVRVAVDAVKGRPRSDRSTVIAIWVSEAPDPNQIFELISYPDFEARARDTTSEPDQTSWWLKHRDVFRSSCRTLMFPAAVSPLT